MAGQFGLLRVVSGAASLLIPMTKQWAGTEGSSTGRSAAILGLAIIVARGLCIAGSTT
jgi:hypothetical protein